MQVWKSDGSNERLTSYEALKSITIWELNKFFEDGNKGPLTPGKLADLVIPDKNLFRVDSMSLKDIRVMETIKEGKSVFKR